MVPLRIKSRAGKHSYRGRRPQRGAALMAVLVCLLVAGLAVLGMLRGAVTEQRQLRDQRQHLQAERLAEAGMDRACAQLQVSAAYSGETWRIAANELGGPSAATVTIRVAAVADGKNERRVFVQSDYPDDSLRRTRKTREKVITLK